MKLNTQYAFMVWWKAKDILSEAAFLLLETKLSLTPPAWVPAHATRVCTAVRGCEHHEMQSLAFSSTSAEASPSTALCKRKRINPDLTENV